MAHRFSYEGAWGEGLTKTIRRTDGSGKRYRLAIWNGKVRPAPHKLDEPLRWRDPSLIFVNSMSDLFHEKAPALYVAAVFGVMAVARHHTYQILTKRSEWMRDVMQSLTHGIPTDTLAYVIGAAQANLSRYASDRVQRRLSTEGAYLTMKNGQTRAPWPLPNVWLGVSVEDAERKFRIEHLRQTPAAIRFLSLEPLLSDLGDLDLSGIDWAIIGGESGHHARPMELAWVRRIVAQCQEQDVAVFVKQLGKCWSDEALSKDKKGGRLKDWPKDLRIRQMPADAQAVLP